MRIAMWSGPRNLSTALMYAFAQRSDCTVVDEPFYGPYLRSTGLDHPMRDEILTDRQADAQGVIADLLAKGPRPHSYHKHMCQHMLPAIPRDFMAECTNVFLLRHPARVIASFAQKYDGVTAEDIGFRQQADLFQTCLDMGVTPVVIDSADIRRNPQAALKTLCAAIGLEWQPQMLSWPAGPKPYDGVWAPHWYKAVHASTGFATEPEPPLPELPRELVPLLDQTMPHFTALKRHCLTIGPDPGHLQRSGFQGKPETL